MYLIYFFFKKKKGEIIKKMNPSEEKTENDLLGAIEEVAPKENVPYDEDDDGIEIETENLNDAESIYFYYFFFLS